jgi:putative spermidine/putrescine transport system permease protein
VLITSFTTSASLRFPPPDLSFRWYQALFDGTRSAHIHRAAGNSLWVASIATLGATILSVLAALAIGRARNPSARALEAAFLSPLILPSLAYGLASLMFFALLGLRPSLTHLIGGHLVVIAPFIFRTTLATVLQLEPALFAGAFLAFVASMDNVPVSLFLSSARTDMLPIRMWGMMESTLDVRVAAVSGVLILAILVLMFVMDRLTGLTRRMTS